MTTTRTVGDIIDIAETVVDTKTAYDADGLLLDLFTASALVQVAHGLKRGHSLFLGLPLDKGVDVAFIVLANKAGA